MIGSAAATTSAKSTRPAEYVAEGLPARDDPILYIRWAAPAGPWQPARHDDVAERVSRLLLPARGHPANCGTGGCGTEGHAWAKALIRRSIRPNTASSVAETIRNITNRGCSGQIAGRWATMSIY